MPIENASQMFGVVESGIGYRKQLQEIIHDIDDTIDTQDIEFCIKIYQALMDDRVLRDMKSTKETTNNQIQNYYQEDDELPELECGVCFLFPQKCRCHSQLCKKCNEFKEDCPCTGG